MSAHPRSSLARTALGGTLLWLGFAHGQNIDLSGTVYSMYGTPLPGMVVTLGKANLSATTDKEGKYRLLGSATSISAPSRDLGGASSEIDRFLHVGGDDARSPLLRNLESSRTVYDLDGKAVAFRGMDEARTRRFTPGIYFSRANPRSTWASSQAAAPRSAAIDEITVTFKDKIRGGASVEAYSGTLDIQVSDKLFDRWPQTHAGDKMPDNPGIKVGSYVPAEVKTRILNNGYVAMLIGPDRPACLTDEVAHSRIADLEKGLKEVVEIAGFPAFPEWKNGNSLNWVVLNTGIAGATLPQNGGHQGNRWGHMNFESTPHNPCEWTTYEAGGALHETVHALIAERWVYNNEASGWIHESFNNYLTTTTNALVRKKYTIGWSGSLWLNMSHIPLEAMGLATDGYVAGPADQGMDGRTYHSTQHRYGGEIFFLSLSQVMGRGFNVSLFMTPARNSQKSILQVFHGIYGDEAYASAIMSFAAKGAILDFEEWTETIRSTMKGNWNSNYWFYMFPGGDGKTTFSPPAAKAPHHQGRNVIPIKLDPGATSVTVEFTPDAKGSKGTPEKMLAQIVYRDKNDKPVYGPVFSGGQRTYKIPAGARNDLVNLVVAVVHPNATTGGDDGSNKGFDAQETFNYKARIVSGGTIAPTTVRPW